jgi:hypothetical protein
LDAFHKTSAHEFSFICMIVLLHFRKFWLILLLLLPFVVAGQDFTISWGEEKVYSKIPARQLIGRDSTGFYILRYQRADDRTMQIDKYSYNQYLQVQSFAIEMPRIGRKNAVFEKIYLLDDHFVLFSSHYENSEDINYAFASLINLKGEIIKPAVEVDRIEKVKSRKNTGWFEFRLSPDSTYLLAFHNTPFEKFSSERFSIRLFDDELNPIWSNKFQLPYEDQNFEVTNFVLDNQQNVYMVCALYGNEFVRGEQNSNKRYSMLHYNHHQKKLTEFEINVDDRWFHSARFQIVGDTSLVVAGFYANSGQGNIAGAFYLHFNTQTDELESSGFEPLPRDILASIGVSGDFSMSGGAQMFALRNLLVKSDGGVVLVAEKEYVNTSTYIDPYTGQYITNYHYHFDEVLFVGLDASGAIDFATVLPKSQTSTNDTGPYSSIAVNLHNDDVYVLYNENPANVTSRGESRSLNNFSKSVAMLARVDSNGNLSREPLFSIKDFGGILKPKFSREQAQSRQVIYGEQNGKDKFGEIIFKP